MPDDDYHTPGGGLKLKGSKPSGVKKKKKKPSSSSTPSRDTALQKAAAGDDDASSSKPSEEDELRELEPRDPHDGKTAAEKAAEDMRRKRLSDRLAREGNKTHKEKVEELNKYLSKLSEHHDMPRIGPG